MTAAEREVLPVIAAGGEGEAPMHFGPDNFGFAHVSDLTAEELADWDDDSPPVAAVPVHQQED